MNFPFIEAKLEILDSLELGYIEMKLTYTKNTTAITDLIKKHFTNKARLQNDVSFVTTSVPLTDEGKGFIKSIVAELKNLDEQFETRTPLVDEFKNLLA